MSKVEIDGEKLNEAKIAADALESSIKTSYEQCDKLISYVESANWKGKSRDTFLSYIDIISKYHNDLKSAVALQTKALNNLESYMNDFKQDSSVKEVKNL
ncbi:WXG100 family type VII secretion target [Lentibacillus sp. N15]|uniref:WXG100 family type VII secretion target n=1 Tax=Lentibacillus songyuanensis TaxID=3136161 RepID=UPI0031BAC4B6